MANKAKDPKSSVPSAITRFDEFTGIHNSQTDYVHTVGHFILWHRYFLGAFEDALEKECGYAKGIPYWDWLIDSESNLPMDQWPIFDPKTGFGGEGVWNLTEAEKAEQTLHPITGTFLKLSS